MHIQTFSLMSVIAVLESTFNITTVEYTGLFFLIIGSQEGFFFDFGLGC